MQTKLGDNLKKRTKPSSIKSKEEGILKRKKTTMSIGELFHKLLSYNVDTLDNIRYKLTIDQVYLFYEKCIKEDIDNQKIDAITMANALNYSSPSHSRGDLNKKTQAWNRFMDALTWDKIKAKSKKSDPQTLSNIFGALGVPSTNPIKKEVE